MWRDARRDAHQGGRVGPNRTPTSTAIASERTVDGRSAPLEELT